MKKINLAEFQTSKLTLNERLNTKGGSGVTSSRSSGTSCTGSDHDFKRTDRD
jgi:hypothetical protein